MNSTSPNFFIVGCVKGGTTSMHHYLGQHPDIYLTPIKETNYFSRKDIDAKNFREDYAVDIKINLKKYFEDRPLKPVHIAHINETKDYLELFSESKNEKILGEICNSYLICPSTAEEIQRSCPDAKIAMVLRNPVDRAFSQYLMNIKEAKSINSSFIEEIEKDDKNEKKGWGVSHQYLELGLYYQQVKKYVDLFPKEQIKIIFYDDYRVSPKKILDELCDFLNIDNKFDFDVSLNLNEKGAPNFKYFNYLLTRLGVVKMVKPLFSKEMKRRLFSVLFSQKKLPKIQQAERDFLIDYYKKDISQLSKLIKKDLNAWLS